MWPPKRLAELVATLQAHPDAAGAFGDGRYIDGDGNVFGQWATRPASQEEFLSRATPIPRIAALLVRRTALDKVGLFDERLAYSEDDELILRLLRDSPLVSSMTIVVDYRRHDHNVTLADWRTRYRSGRAAVVMNLEAARRLGESDHAVHLERYVRRLDASTAGNSAGRVIGDLKAGRYREASLDARDSLRISFSGFVRGGVQTVVSRIRSRLTRRRP